MNETFKKQYGAILLAEITELNGENTEEELNMVIMESILEDRLKIAQTNNRNALISERLYSQKDPENIEKNGVYVYDGSSISNLSFEKFDTIANAVRAAVKRIKAYIICDGVIIKYDAINDTEAYYIDDRLHKIMTVQL